MLGWFGLVAGTTCPLQKVTVDGHEVFVDIDRFKIPVGSLVRVNPLHYCESGTGVEVVSIVTYYTLVSGRLAFPGYNGCMKPHHVSSIENDSLIRLPLRGGSGSQQIISSPIEEINCGSDTFLIGNDESISVDELRNYRPLSKSFIKKTLSLQKTYSELLQMDMTDRVWVNDWGYIALPLVHVFGQQELHGQMALEGLVTVEQKSKAITSAGPYWMHFRGSDKQFSDIWGKENTITNLITLSKNWYQYCTDKLNILPIGRCLLRIGDIAWYAPKQPDPLGHKSHHYGKCVDLRLFRVDDSIYEANWKQEDDRPPKKYVYDSSLTNAFIQFARRTSPVKTIIFNDPTIKNVKNLHGHDDHIHLCF